MSKFLLADAPPFVVRRVELLIAEVNSEAPQRDQTITYAMRVISNYCAVGKDVGASVAKRLNRRISKHALALKHVLPHHEWVKKTINEHQEPLSQVWGWLLENRSTLSVQSVYDRFAAFPMVTITREEDDLLNKTGNRNVGDPEQRYRNAQIEIVSTDDELDDRLDPKRPDDPDR
jgi:hypothetical protein